MLFSDQSMHQLARVAGMLKEKISNDKNTPPPPPPKKKKKKKNWQLNKIQILIFSTDPTKPGDLKESFDIGAFDDKKFVSSVNYFPVQ